VRVRERERERERERKWGVVVVRDTTLVGGDGNIIFCLKVPRHCPLVLLVGAVYFLLHNINSVRTSQEAHTSPLCSQEL
jgi:hypothetical protein